MLLQDALSIVCGEICLQLGSNLAQATQGVQNGFGAEGITTVNHCHFLGNSGQIERLFNCCITAADSL